MVFGRVVFNGVTLFTFYGRFSCDMGLEVCSDGGLMDLCEVIVGNKV